MDAKMSSDAALAAIEQVASVSGNAKQTVLQGYPGLIPYLTAAYDPYIRYYLTKCASGGGELQFDEITWKILKQLSTRELSGYDAQSVVNSITAGMTPASADLFGRILRKDLRFGMGAKSINKVFPNLIPIHAIQRAYSKWDPSKVTFPCYGSPKIDGVRGVFNKGKFYFRNGKQISGLQHLENQLNHVFEKVDGELIVPDMTFQQSSGLIRNYGTTRKAQFYVFDLPTVNASFTERLMDIEDICTTSPDLIPTPHISIKSLDMAYKFYNQCRNIGYEGAVLKKFDYIYKDARNTNWIKMKPTKTVDLKVIDLYEGKGKYKGQMGGVIVNYKGKPNKVGSGWSDDQRRIYWGKQGALINKTIEVKFMEETDDGNMRHTVFVKFRGDK